MALSKKHKEIHKLLDFQDLLFKEVKQIISDPIMGKWYELPNELKQDSNYVTNAINICIRYSQPIKENDLIVINRLYNNYHRLIND